MNKLKYVIINLLKFYYLLVSFIYIITSACWISAQTLPFADEQLNITKNKNLTESDSSSSNLDQKSAYKETTSNNTLTITQPNPVPPPAPGKYGVTAGSPSFKNWFKNALGYAEDWNFPDLKNKFGEKITREDFLRAIIWIESNGVHKLSNGKLLRSVVGAIGFMQLMPATARGLGINPSDPQQNLIGGVKYLNQLFNLPDIKNVSGEEKLIRVIIAYNAGPNSSALKKGWSNLKITGKPKETLGYGLKLRMCLGLPLSEDERKLISRIFGVSMAKVDSFANNKFYAPTKGIAP